MRFTNVPMHDDDVQNVQMIELSDEELSEVTGTGGSAAVTRSACGASIPSVSVPAVSSCGSAPMAGWSGPSITALSTANDFAINYSTSLAVSNSVKNSFLTLG